MTKETICLEGGTVHATETTGLDNIDADRLSPKPANLIGEVLCTTRKCVWCGRQEAKPYGDGGRKPWRAVTR